MILIFVLILIFNVFFNYCIIFYFIIFIAIAYFVVFDQMFSMLFPCRIHWLAEIYQSLGLLYHQLGQLEAQFSV